MRNVSWATFKQKNRIKRNEVINETNSNIKQNIHILFNITFGVNRNHKNHFKVHEIWIESHLVAEFIEKGKKSYE